MIEIKGTNKKFMKYIPFGCIIPFILMFFPYIINSKISYNGIKFTMQVAKTIGNQNTLFFSVICLLSVCIIPVLLLITGLVMIFKPSKALAKTIFFVNIIYILTTTSLMLGFKTHIDSWQILNSEFLIKDLSIGYWLSIIIGAINLIIIMKYLKINIGYIVLVVMSLMWLFPIIYIFLNSLRMEGSFYVSYFIPKKFGFGNYSKVITDTSKFHYVRWFKNTLLVASCSCIISSFIVISTSYVLSKVRFKGRKMLMNMLLVLGMFPGFMSMIAVYYILKGMGLAQSLIALIIVYSASASLGYYVAKGFLDTIPRALEEAAYIDGATKMQVFFKIIIPLSKPIIIYTILTSFMAPWADYIFASIILGDKTEYYTIAMGLFSMISKENIDASFKMFAAGAVLVSVPIATLFMCLQKYYVEGLSGAVKG